MSPSQLPSEPRWWELVEAACDETTTEDQRREIERLMAADAGFRRFFAAYMDLVAEFCYRGQEAEAAAMPVAAWATQLAAEGLAGRMDPMPARGRRRRTVAGGLAQTKPWWIALVVGLAVVIGAVLVASRGRREAAAPPALPDAPPEASPVWARLARQRDCRWAAASADLASAAAVPNAQVVALEAGMAELQFACGASAVVRGPSQFSITGANNLHLARGEVSVEIDSAACPSFTVSTPTARVVDQGTAFAVRVTSQGDAEVDVFQGAVETMRLEEAKRPQERAIPIRLVAGEALRVRPGGFEGRVADRSRQLRLDAPGNADRFQCWQAWARTVRHDPTLVAFFDFQPSTRGSLRLENLATARGARAGTIDGATWDEGRWRESWALRFGHPAGTTSIDLAGPYTELTLAAWVAIDGRAAAPGHLLASTHGGKRDGCLRWSIDPAGRMALGVSRRGEPSEVRHEAPVPTAFQPGRWTQVALVWSRPQGQLSFFVDGRCVGNETLAEPIALWPGVCRLGTLPQQTPAGADSSPFRGRIGELVAFRRALSQAELGFLFATGRAENQ